MASVDEESCSEKRQKWEKWKRKNGWKLKSQRRRNIVDMTKGLLICLTLTFHSRSAFMWAPCVRGLLLRSGHPSPNIRMNEMPCMCNEESALISLGPTSWDSLEEGGRKWIGSKHVTVAQITYETFAQTELWTPGQWQMVRQQQAPSWKSDLIGLHESKKIPPRGHVRRIICVCSRYEVRLTWFSGA